MTREEIDTLPNVSTELEFVEGARFTRVYHNDRVIAILTCPGDYLLVQNASGTLEARWVKQLQTL